jgi:hypothetical protein
MNGASGSSLGPTSGVDDEFHIGRVARRAAVHRVEVRLSAAGQTCHTIDRAVPIDRTGECKYGVTFREDAAAASRCCRRAGAGASGNHRRQGCCDRDAEPKATSINAEHRCYVISRKIEQSYRFYLPTARRINRPRSFASISRPFATTATIRRVCRMSCNGLPASSTRSANFPTAIVPMESSSPK